MFMFTTHTHRTVLPGMYLSALTLTVRIMANVPRLNVYIFQNKILSYFLHLLFCFPCCTKHKPNPKSINCVNRYTPSSHTHSHKLKHTQQKLNARVTLLGSDQRGERGWKLKVSRKIVQPGATNSFSLVRGRCDG